MALNLKKLFGFISKQPAATTLIDLFDEQVNSNPDKIALVYKNEKLSYKQLYERTNQLAHYLRAKGVKEETLVPIFIEKSIDMMVSILGILRAGAAFVPIDPGYPAQRIKFILDDIGTSPVITNMESRTKLLVASSSSNLIMLDGDRDAIGKMSSKKPANKIEPHHLAYIIYTSGSTGNPKGVMIEHKSIFNYLLNSRERFIKKDENGSGTFIHIPYTFDASLKSIFTPLVSGKLSVISSKPSPLIFDDANLHKYAPYDFIQLTPAHLDFFYEEFKDKYNKPITEKISIGGEALYLSHFDPIMDQGDTLEVINEYGPTEATVACTGYYFHVGKDKNIPKNPPIGKPINNVRIYILDDDMQPVKAGEKGEICITGVQIARGYLNQPELTKMKFLPDTFSNEGGKIYKSGDMGRWLPDGNIEYGGRIDTQVKIRGHRIELGEIESILIGNEQIKNAVVEQQESKQGDKRLVAYVVPFGKFDKQAVIAYLKDKLPQYLIPEKIIELESLPLTSNGKIDRKQLAAME
jgi:amino acid adenylation domain-containing protein